MTLNSLNSPDDSREWPSRLPDALCHPAECAQCGSGGALTKDKLTHHKYRKWIFTKNRYVNILEAKLR